MEPWLAKLNVGQGQEAWDLFAERYRRLILATIRRLVDDHDDVMDVFSSACEALSADDFARLRRYSEHSSRGATVATWLVAVIRNLTVDWLRRRDGRRRLTVPATLTPLQQKIYAAICLDGASHIETYELIVASGALLTFPEFLREVRSTSIAAPCPGATHVRRQLSISRTSEAAEALERAETIEATISTDTARRLDLALAAQPDDVRLAVELFVIDGLSAAAVAAAVGWPSAKSVYNRVYRALASLRASLEREGIGPTDL
ncbi:MAG: sigma-70 family RNA polymerase sigma factor [Gemmatimonadota bacterium]